MATKKTKPKAKRAKQLDIPGTAPKINGEVTSAAEKFLNAREEWEDAGKAMSAAKSVLEQAMRKHSLKSYRDAAAHLDVQFVEGEAKLKVKRLDAEG